METRPTLYLMVGYPGAGKTTAAKAIQKLTGAVHLWADHERRERFGQPRHTEQESLELYDGLNRRTEQYLGQGKDVVFDTSFRFRRDRDHLRQIAENQDARSRVLWVQVPRELAQERAITQDEQNHTRVLGRMPIEAFNRMADSLEEPAPDENPVVLDGTKITPEYVKKALDL